MKFFLVLIVACSLEARGLGGSLLPGSCHPWEAVNRHTQERGLAEELDPDIRSALEGLGLQGVRVLDIGSGMGIQSCALAGEGFDVVGIDISATAVQRARQRQTEGSVVFMEGNILAPELPGHFQVLLDRGCMHFLEPEEWGSYRAAVSELLDPGGYLLLKMVSIKEPICEGPHHFSLEEVREIFDAEFELVRAQDSLYEGQSALFCVLKRRAADGSPSAALEN